MSQIAPEVLVIGAGVSGLTTAVSLAEAGVPVRIRTQRLPRESTSFAAGAIWGPYLVSHPHIDQWSWLTYDTLAVFAGRQPELTGVRMVSGIEASRQRDDPPNWAAQLPDFRLCSADELPPGFVSGWRYRAPVLDMPVYLDYLTARLGNAGGKIEIDALTSLDDAQTQAQIAVNCTGIGARRLVPDEDLTPVRGQLAVAPNPGLQEFFAEFSEEVDDLTYFLPQGDHIILGGSAAAGEEEMRWDQAITDAIVERCGAVEPRLRGARVTESRVGIRPSRSVVRVEHVRLGGGRHVIHNYGHGGAGVSLSWGCASEVREMVLGIVEELNRG